MQLPQHFICKENGHVIAQTKDYGLSQICNLVRDWTPTTGQLTCLIENATVSVSTEYLEFENQAAFLVTLQSPPNNLSITDIQQPVFLQLQMNNPIPLKQENQNQLIEIILKDASIGFCSDTSDPLFRSASSGTIAIATAQSVLGLPRLLMIVQRAINDDKADAQDRLISTNLQIIEDCLVSINCVFRPTRSLVLQDQPTSQLLSRPQLIHQIEQLIKLKKHFFLLMIDIDNFKMVNSTLGHVLGDTVLKELALRIFDLSKKRKGITAHLNGDKFAWIIPVKSVKHDIESLAYRMLTDLRQPLLINKIPLEMDASIGIASFPKEGRSPVSLLRKAESALLHAKSSSFKVKQYQSNIDQSPQQKLMVMAGIPNAILNQEFHLVFQPQVHIKSQQIKGFECLLRWSKNNKSFSPGLFIPLAEMSHHIHDITKWVIRECLSQLAYWQTLDKDWTVSINFSSKNLMDTRLVSYLSSQCVHWDIPTKYVVIEVTESALMVDIESAKLLLQKLHNEGFQISIDDFGTGYSSLAYLKQLPVNMIKIDKVFVTEVNEDKTDAAICKALIDMSHSLDIEVVAEGIENESALMKLKELNCDYAQGFLISKGIAADRVIEFDKIHRKKL